ncbi:hypothetical protein PVK06_041535 [Gossypium arboreum]|uniref:Retrovirus-related Pol polyprotein from transposon TNT 1-94 n=1 Tax=Gossypium arboreum TaxID=29729 RepID=A0ABR0N9D7_GOSAR|nr:hypothetical protein PVK06_041535 [Gossypium arboreum]
MVQQETTNNVFIKHQSGMSVNNISDIREYLAETIDRRSSSANRTSTTCLVENPIFHARTKHIKVHYHYIRKKVFEREINMVPTKTDEQVAEIFKKSLSRLKFEKFRQAFGMICKSSVERSLH